MANNLDFTESLAQLQGQNILGGVVVSAQADLIKNQTMAVKNVITNFSQRLKDFESNPLTTDEQLIALTKDINFQKGSKSLANQIADYQTFTTNIKAREEALNNLYGGTATALSAIGGKQAGRIAGTLGQQQKTKLALLESKRKSPLETIQYKQFLYDTETNRLRGEETRLKIEDIKQNKEVSSLLSAMITSPEFNNMVLAYNSETGIAKYQYKTKNGKTILENLRDSLYEKYGSKPQFQKAWTALDDYIRKNTKIYRPQWRDTSLQNQKNLVDWLTTAKTQFYDLQKFTNEINKYQFDSNYSNYRNAYESEALVLYKERTDKNKFKFNFGADPKVIEAMPPGDYKKAAQRIYSILYDPTSKDYYYKYLRKFENFTKYEVNGYKVDANNPDMNTSSIRLVDGTVLNIGGTYITQPDGTKKFSDGIITDWKGSYYNPQDPTSHEDYSSYLDRTQKERKLKLENKLPSNRGLGF